MLFQTVKLPIESADVNSSAKYRGRRIDIITNLQLADRLAVVCLYGMYPAGFVAKHKASINERRRSPDCRLRLVPPNDFTFVGRQGIQIAVARADVNSSIRNDGTRPESALFLTSSTERLVLPKQLAVTLTEAINHAILSGRVDFAFVDSGRRIRVSADARFPDCRAVAQVQAIEIAVLGSDVCAIIDHRETALHRSEPFRFVDQRAIIEIETVEESIFATEVDAVVDDGCGAIDFESGFVFPNERAVPRVDAVDVVIETAGNQAVAHDCRRGFQAVFGFVSPDQPTVVFIETIKTTVSGPEVDAVFVH